MKETMTTICKNCEGDRKVKIRLSNGFTIKGSTVSFRGLILVQALVVLAAVGVVVRQADAVSCKQILGYDAAQGCVPAAQSTVLSGYGLETLTRCMCAWDEVINRNTVKINTVLSATTTTTTIPPNFKSWRTASQSFTNVSSQDLDTVSISGLTTSSVAKITITGQVQATGTEAMIFRLSAPSDCTTGSIDLPLDNYYSFQIEFKVTYYSGTTGTCTVTGWFQSETGVPGFTTVNSQTITGLSGTLAPVVRVLGDGVSNNVLHYSTVSEVGG
jgi:hypothetical protein